MPDSDEACLKAILNNTSFLKSFCNKIAEQLVTDEAWRKKLISRIWIQTKEQNAKRVAAGKINHIILLIEFFYVCQFEGIDKTLTRLADKHDIEVSQVVERIEGARTIVDADDLLDEVTPVLSPDFLAKR